MKTEIGGFYRPVESADATALQARSRARHHGRALVIAEAGDAVTEAIAGLLAEHGLKPVLARPAAAGRPDPATVELIVLAGSEPYATARSRATHEHELAWLRAADAAGTPVLGLGHGARALADALGGEITTLDDPYRGWAFVDTIAPHQISAGPWLAWQHDLIELPAGAQVIAHNRFGPQAFRLRRHLGVQFHPEATERAVGRWVEEATEAIALWQVLGATRRDPAAAAACSEQLFSTFLHTL